MTIYNETRYAFMVTEDGFSVWYNGLMMYIEKTALGWLDRALAAKAYMEKIKAGKLNPENIVDAGILEQMEYADMLVHGEKLDKQ